jgi:hypothetical protein
MCKSVHFGKELNNIDNLIELPCNAGDTVYVLKTLLPKHVDIYHGLDYRKYLVDENEVLIGRIVNLKITQYRKTIKIAVKAKYYIDEDDREMLGTYISINLPFSAIGKTVFLTEDEAKQKM